MKITYTFGLTSMAGVKRPVKVTLDGPRSEVVHDFVVQYEVCLKTCKQAYVCRPSLTSQSSMITIIRSPRCRKGKERKSIYIAPFIYYAYLKALRHGSHSFICKYTMPAFSS